MLIDWGIRSLCSNPLRSLSLVCIVLAVEYVSLVGKKCGAV
jgi:hypothetical protein